MSSPPSFPNLATNKETPELRFSPNYEESEAESAWAWFQEAMAEDKEDTLKSLGELFTVKLRPIFKGVVAGGVLTARKNETLSWRPEKDTRESFGEWVEARRRSALNTVMKYSSTVILVGFLDPNKIHYGARTEIPYSALLLLLHKLGFDPLKPLRNPAVKDRFQKMLGEVIVRQTAKAIREGRRVVLKPYVERIARKVVDFIREFLFGAESPQLKPDLETKTLYNRNYNKSHGLADYQGNKGIEEPLFETGQMYDEVSYSLEIPTKPINDMLDELERIEEEELRRRKEIIKKEENERRKQFELWQRENRKWREAARKRLEAQRKKDWAWSIENSEEGKSRKRIAEIHKKMERLLGAKDFDEAEYEKLNESLEETETRLDRITHGAYGKENSIYSSKLLRSALSKYDRSQKEFAKNITQFASLGDIDLRRKIITTEVEKRKNDLRDIISFSRGLAKTVTAKDGKLRIVMADGHSESELSKVHKDGILQAAQWVLDVIRMARGLGK